MKVLKFGAVWCAGCLVMRPRWQEIEKELPWLKTEYYDIDNDDATVKQYQIETGIIPTAIFLDNNGKEILRLNGEVSKSELLAQIEKNKDK